MGMMAKLIKLLPLKYKRKLNKLLRYLGLVAEAKKRVRGPKPDSGLGGTQNSTMVS